MQTKLAARRDQPIHHQQLQHLGPAHAFAPRVQTRAPELCQPQLMPQLAGQPAIAERARTPQFQPAQLDLQTVDGILRNRPVIRKQTDLLALAPLLVKDLNALAPRLLLLIVDLAQIQHRALRLLSARQTPVLYHAEIAMRLAVFLAERAAQEHRNSRMPDIPDSEKRVGLHYSRLRIGALKAQRLSAISPGKSPGTAKVRLISANSTTLRVGNNQRGILPRASQEPEEAFDVNCELEAGTLQLSERPRCG
jgi:hypothetical protein